MLFSRRIEPRCPRLIWSNIEQIKRHYETPLLAYVFLFILSYSANAQSTVPSAAEMKATGLNVEMMNMLLLKKVEELTLHFDRDEGGE